MYTDITVDSEYGQFGERYIVVCLFDVMCNFAFGLLTVSRLVIRSQSGVGQRARSFDIVERYGSTWNISRKRRGARDSQA